LGSGQREAEGSASFLKKRSKKLLLALRGGSLNDGRYASSSDCLCRTDGSLHAAQRIKSFLLLFFKKDALP
jgi:hypothetical protein